MESRGRAQTGEVFLGYCRKQMPGAPEWLGDARVASIASVSECIARRPEGWVERWDFNAAGFYDSVECADAASTGIDRGEFLLFAFTIIPLRFDPLGGAVEVSAGSVFGSEFAPPPAGESLSGMRFLGYDAVQRWAERRPGHAEASAVGGGFGCSPLSCNRRSHEFEITENCLLRDWESAWRAASDFARADGAEPGCFYVFGVYLKDEGTS